LGIAGVAACGPKVSPTSTATGHERAPDLIRPLVVGPHGAGERPDGLPSDAPRLPWDALATPPHVSDSAALASTAAASLAWIARNPSDPAVTQGITPIDAARRDQTLAQLVLADNARLADGHDRLADAAWVARAFVGSPWVGDRPGYEGKIRMTRYLAYEVDGCAARTEACSTALYATPADDATRLAYTRQDVVGGVFEPGGAAEGLATPLVWMTVGNLYRALMQGTIVVRVEDGTQRTFNVHRNNGIAYDRRQPDQGHQRRYWYFREVDGLYGYGPEQDRIRVEPRATVAGNVADLGVGRVLWLRSATNGRLVILADTGGAFDHNLGQLDYLAGIFPDDAGWRAATQDLSDGVDAAFIAARDAWLPAPTRRVPP
jgi:hypothetical protein